jgi:predicted nucleotidyltransferase
MKREEIESCTIFLCLAGSKAYGTDTPESDTDIRGVCIPRDPAYYIGMGLKSFEQSDKGWDDDRCIYDLRKAINLMADGNPNMVDLLFTDERHWLQCNREWSEVIAHREKFLSKRMRFTYGGYAFAQLKRIQRHRGYLMNPPKKKPERSDYKLPDRKVIGKEDIGAIQWLLANFLKNTVQYMNFSQQAKAELDEHANYIGTVQSNLSGELTEQHWSVIQKALDASDEFIAFMMREKSYLNELEEWNSYESWKNTRNDKRQALEAKFGYDTKHASHLVRLMRMGMEILETGKVHVFREDREELKAIRNGAWTYEEVVDYADKCEERLNELYKTSKLPHNPDRHFLDKLCQDLVKGYVFG